MKKSFTLAEILIVVGLLAIISFVVLVLFNPLQQLNKGYDARRKHDLSELQKALEEYYNDTGCYPTVDELCYDVNTNLINLYSYTGSWLHKSVISQVCHICGQRESDPPKFASFQSYLDPLPCDPQHRQKQYLYNVPAKTGLTGITSPTDAKNSCPKWYGVYSEISDDADPQSLGLGCALGGCGIRYDEDSGSYLIPSGTLDPYPLGYGYGVSSPNRKVATTDRYVCYSDNACNYCYDTYEECVQKNPTCPKIYASKGNCCADHSSATGCPSP